jgi:pyruvate carboxylase
MRAANELGKRTVAIYAEEDKLSLHRFKADEDGVVRPAPHEGAVDEHVDVGHLRKIP